MLESFRQKDSLEVIGSVYECFCICAYACLFMSLCACACVCLCVNVCVYVCAYVLISVTNFNFFLNEIVPSMQESDQFMHKMAEVTADPYMSCFGSLSPTVTQMHALGSCVQRQSQITCPSFHIPGTNIHPLYSRHNIYIYTPCIIYSFLHTRRNMYTLYTYNIYFIYTPSTIYILFKHFYTPGAIYTPFGHPAQYTLFVLLVQYIYFTYI